MGYEMHRFNTVCEEIFCHLATARREVIGFSRDHGEREQNLDRKVHYNFFVSDPFLTFQGFRGKFRKNSMF